MWVLDVIQMFKIISWVFQSHEHDISCPARLTFHLNLLDLKHLGNQIFSLNQSKILTCDKPDSLNNCQVITIFIPDSKKFLSASEIS